MAGTPEILDDLLSDNYYSKIVNSETAIPEKEYYVYAIVNLTDEKIAYIGKGTKNRVLSHFKEKNTNYTSKYIKEMRDQNKDVEYRIIYKTTFENKALLYESKLIKHINQFEKLLNISQSEPHISDLKCIKAIEELMVFIVNKGVSIPAITPMCQEIFNIAFQEYKNVVKSNPTLRGKTMAGGKPLEDYSGFKINNGH